ncbi:Uma2 family endonuclease [Kineococcus sp. SYSU DK006]|uniref:Uma2 family endonuclease n=1 Tax=Kineococcus sp. SYSU DK006 TaxID=3383127 RepID=UPI003D7CAE69
MSVSIGTSLPLHLEDLPHDDGGPRIELVDGGLIVTPMAGPAHQYVVGELQARLLASAPAGWVVLPGTDVARRDPHDRRLKRELYAQWRVPHYWIADHSTRTLTWLVLTADRRYEEGAGQDGWLAQLDAAGIWPR